MRPARHETVATEVLVAQKDDGLTLCVLPGISLDNPQIGCFICKRHRVPFSALFLGRFWRVPWGAWVW